MSLTKANLSNIKVDGLAASPESMLSPGSSETVLMLPFDGTNSATSTTDKSSTGHTVTFNGTAQISTAQSKFGGSSLLLDGNSDYLSLADHADWTFGTGEFTIECWVRFTSTSGVQFLWSSTADVAGFLRFSWNDSSSYWHWYDYTTGSQTFADTISTDTWYHLAFVRASGSVKLYRDGVQKGSSISNATSLDPGGISIGRDWSGAGGSYFSGYLDGFRITKGVARYTSGFTPPTTSHYTAGVTGSAAKHIVVDSSGAGAEEGSLVEDNNRIAKAWVNFNGTGTVAIRGSYNVSSITDNGTGDYTANLSTALSNTNASAVAMTGYIDSTWGIPMFKNVSGESKPLTTTKFRVATVEPETISVTYFDNAYVTMLIFGN